MGLFQEIQKALKEAMEEAQRQNLPTPRAGQRPRPTSPMPEQRRLQPGLDVIEPAEDAPPRRILQAAAVTTHIDSRSKRADLLHRRLRQPQGAREAILLAELLAPPIALRGRAPLQMRRGL